MAKVNVSLPQGTRDFGPEVVRKRQYILNTIKEVFELYGFQPLETPAMENLDTLMGKYGEEGDKLIFRIRSNRSVFNTYPDRAEEIKKSLKDVEDFDYSFLPHKPNQALKYDLTIPFARYVAMNYGQLTMPFKRYQMQPVWRGDRPQRGRYREFYQCDADVVGSKSLLNEVELATIYATVFKKLGIGIEIKINNRKILSALAQLCGGAEQLTNITVAIDKLDKIGLEKVKEELTQRGLAAEQVSIIEKYLQITGSKEAQLEKLTVLLGNIEEGKQGIEELSFVLNYSPITTHQSPLTIDPTLARGLNYYTGCIFEVKASGVSMGSIGGGGRYDDLTGLFGVPNVPGVGISFGVDRIYDVLEELNLFPATVHTGTQVLFFNLGEAESRKAFEAAQQLRGKGVRCELFHEQAKFDKQFKYAEKKQIPFVVIIGNAELENNQCNVKKMSSGEQTTVALTELEVFNFG
jgi:histidyl-tRNA synthetase